MTWSHLLVSALVGYGTVAAVVAILLHIYIFSLWHKCREHVTWRHIVGVLVYAVLIGLIWPMVRPEDFL